MGKYDHLLSPVKIGSIWVKNRIVFAPMCSNFADASGAPSNLLSHYYIERAKGGCGLLIVEAAALRYPSNKSVKRQLCYNDLAIACEWKKTIDVIHSYGAKVIAQVNDNGFNVKPNANKEWKENLTASNSVFQKGKPGREMNLIDIHNFISTYVQTADVIKNAGFDGLEIHACHGDIQTQFLSPLTNCREDQYGGSVENRARFLTEAIAAIRAKVGESFIISVRLSSQDYYKDGITLEMAGQTAHLCEMAGANFINCSSGFVSLESQSSEGEFSEEGDRIFFGEAIKPFVHHAVIGVVGKLTDPLMCENIIKDQKTDLVILGRQLICDPAWPLKVELGKENEIRPCLYCREGCLNQLNQGHPIRCALNPFVGYDDWFQENNLPKAVVSKKILVIGGGVAGMQSAIILKKRGHDVLIVEKTDHLGGQMELAAVPPHKEKVHEAVEWFKNEVLRLHIPVRYNMVVDVDYVQSVQPDEVILATGSCPFVPNIPGIDAAVEAWQILKNREMFEASNTIAIIGGGTVGCELAAYLLRDSRSITIIEMTADFCKGQEAVHKEYLLNLLDDNNVQRMAETKVTRIDDHKLIYENSQGIEETLFADVIVSACGQVSQGEDLKQQINNIGIPVYIIGDAKNIGNFRTATRNAFDVAVRI